MKAITDRNETAASVSNMDQSVEAFGSQILFSDDDVPTVSDSLINRYEEIVKLLITKEGTDRTGKYIKAIEIIKKNQ